MGRVECMTVQKIVNKSRLLRIPTWEANLNTRPKNKVKVTKPKAKVYYWGKVKDTI